MKVLPILVALLITVNSFGQSITMSEKRSTVLKIADMISRKYVLIDTGRMMVDKIVGNLEGGVYDTIFNHTAFAQTLTSDIRSVYHDKHMGIYYKGAIKGKKRENLKALKNSERYHWKILDGNIGYFDLNTFMFHDPKGKRLVNEVLGELSTAKVIVIDVRGNWGGNANMSNYLAGQFLPPKTHISTVYKRKGNQLKPIKKYWSKGRFDHLAKPDVAVYVLINKGTASAGESVPYILQSFGRAIVVGENSAGAAHANVEKSVNESFLMLMPHEKRINSVTSSDYEYTGVVPDIPVDPELALETVQKLIKQEVSDE